MIENSHSPWLLESHAPFPSPAEMPDDDVVAIGGALTAERVAAAYRQGIFPWPHGDAALLLWHCPDPRYVVFADELHVSRTVRRLLGKGTFQVTRNRMFSKVMDLCRRIPRRNQRGTWITSEMATVYSELHRMGMAHSIEVMKDGELAGGFYGVQVGPVFCAESMFTLVSGASQCGFATFVAEFRGQGGRLIDCQMKTPVSAQFGGRFIPRSEFLQALRAP